jgi:DNA polymerase III sliding clamp (beta) subunit (PCNA family)
MLIAIDLLKAALFCASSEETRYYLRGVHLNTSGHMVTTDGHRMFVARLNERPSADVIVPYADVVAALKLAGGRAKDIEIDLAANRIGQISFAPVDGTFPDWRRVVPTGLETPSAKDPSDNAAHVHFDHRYVGDFAKMAAILCGKAVTTTSQSVLHPVSASHPALVTFGDRADCFAVLMPVRRKRDESAVQTRNIVMAG